MLSWYVLVLVDKDSSHQLKLTVSNSVTVLVIYKLMINVVDLPSIQYFIFEKPHY